MKKVKVTLPKEVASLPLEQRADLIKSISEQIGLPVHVHTSENPDRDMWTPDEVPMIAELEDWFYGELFRSTWEIYTTVIEALGLPIPEAQITSIEKSFGTEFFDYLQKSAGGFKLGDMIRMQRKSREKLLSYIADGGVYTREQIQRMKSLLDASIPDYAALLEAYAVRAVLLGKIKRVADANTLQLIGTLIRHLPAKIEEVEEAVPPIVLTDPQGKRHIVQMHPLTDAEKHAILYAEQHAGQYVTNATARLKTGIQQIITDGRRTRQTPQEVQQKLLERFGTANRDWRSIALTEITDAMANGYLASITHGSKVIGQGAGNACPHCKRLIIGQTYTVVKEAGDPMTEVWVGKSNVGRKARDYVATIPLHPHCRCRWVLLSEFQTVNNGVISIKPLDQLIKEYKKKGLIHSAYTMDGGAPVQKSLEVENKAHAFVTGRKIAPVEVTSNDLPEVAKANDGERTISLYHKTPTRNVASIKEQGLIPREKKPTTGQNPAYNAVYFHTDPRKVDTFDTGEPSTVLRVDLPLNKETARRLRPDEDSFHKTAVDAIRHGDAVAYIGQIPSTWIHVAH